jgi:hypothetical protein
MMAIDSRDKTQETIRTPVLLLVILAATPLAHFGCEKIALMPKRTLESRSGAGTFTVTGVVEGFDFDRQEIYMRTEGGKSQIVSYSDRTQVSVDQRRISPSRIQIGDSIEVWLREDSSGRTMAESIRIGQTHAQHTTLEGTVERVLLERDAIELRTPAGELIVVYLRPGSPARTKEEFRRIRAGDFVRFEGAFLSDNRFELNTVL